MDESYRISVLHIVNPHVIIVESQDRKGVPVIQQVGLYGILPVNKTVDIDGQVVSERCENWPVAASTILREFLADHNDAVHFVPIQIENRSTIFDENTHQFGDIIVISGKRISISDHLVTLGIADKDECVFQQKLASGGIRIKLNSVRTEEVINAIKKYYQKQKKVEHDWQKTIKKQTSVYQESKKISSNLTEKNLKLFEKNSDCMKSVMETIQRKERDLDLCKDADIPGVGCGNRHRSSRPNSTMHKKTIAEKKDDLHPSHDVLNNMKSFFNAHGVKKNISNYDDFKTKSQHHGVEQSTPYKKSHKHETIVTASKKQEIENNSADRQQNIYDDNHQDAQKEKFLHYHHEETLHKISNYDENQNIPPRKPRNQCEKLERSQQHHGQSYQHQSSLDESWDGEMNSKCEEAKNTNVEKGSKPTSKKATTATKAKERLRIYCPDMEMCSSNLKNFIPSKVIEEYGTDDSKPTQNIDIYNSKFDVVGNVESKVDLKTIDLDRLQKLANRDEDDETDYQNQRKINRNIRESHLQQTNPKIQNTSKTIIDTEHRLVSSILRKKLQVLKESQKRDTDNSFSSNSDTSVKDTSSSTGQSKTEPERPSIELPQPSEQVLPTLAHNIIKVKRNVNPFKNLDGSKSVFVEKLVRPSIMVHTKNDNLILPQCELRDIPFKTDIHFMLKSMRIYKPKPLQSVSWSYILRGYSVFMVSAAGNGKTLGYVPAVCNLVMDSSNDVAGVGPFCVIVCATAMSVTEVETCCKRFLGLEERIITCFPGIDPADITTALLNGCHVLICTAPMLVSLLEVDFGVDLRRLMVLVFDDCERLSEVYSSELGKILQHVKAMIKNRSDKSLKVQYVVASRQWCDFMTPLAKKAPDTVITIGAFQECVLYSKTKTSVNFVKNKDSKVKAVVEFLGEIDRSKRTVIACRDDDEVILLEGILKKLKHTVFPCNSTMNVHDLYQLNETWGNYQEPVLGPILICCDGNLTHLNITNASYLVHFSMPAMFTAFCKRFSVLNDNYASIFREENENVKIKIFLDETNVEQLPKILNFVKRCTKESFPMLDNVMQDVLLEKDLKKAEIMVPICNNLLMLGECIDVSNCLHRHTIFNQSDESKDWLPRQGIITFKITHVDTAVTYSARVLSKTTKAGTTKYPNNYNTMSLKMGMYYSKEVNQKLHGTPKLGDICAVAVKQNFFERCQVMKIIPTDSGKSIHVLINLIDKEKLTMTTDVHLYYLPDEFKDIETHTVIIRLANIQPKDKDVTFSMAAKKQIRAIVERDSENVLYMRGRVVMTLGNTIFVDTAEACVDLSSLGETVVRSDIKKELLNRHAEPNPQHIEKLKKLGGVVNSTNETEPKVTSNVQKLLKWAHLEKDELSPVFLSSAVDASMMFVRLAKFGKVMFSLHNDIKAYVDTAAELDSEEIYVGNIVLAEFPDDKTYERAMIDAVVDEQKVKCFFVDHGDWRHVSKDKLKPITDNILHRIPFQAIECRLIGVKPPGDADTWPEFTTCWLEDFCYEDNDGNDKCLYLKYFTKEQATTTGEHKYGVVLFDTLTDHDVVVNKKMIELNLAKENKYESKYIDEPLTMKRINVTDSSSGGEDTRMENSIETSNIKDLVSIQPTEQLENEGMNHQIGNILFKKPIRSVPLVNDSDSDDFDKWDVNVDKGLLGMFGQPSKANVTEYTPHGHASEEESNSSLEKEMIGDKHKTVKTINNVDTSSNKSKGSNSRSTRISRLDYSQENSEYRIKSPMLESLSDSDNIDIGSEKMAALNVFKNKFITKDITENGLQNVNLVVNTKTETTESGSKMNESIDKLKKNDTLDSDDLSSIASEIKKSEAIVTNTPKVTEIEPPRKPKLVWRQSKNSITVKIILIGVENYVLEINERNLKFKTWHNDINYEFDFVLYGVVNSQKSAHSNKGQYIQVNLIKMLQRNWLNLSKDCSAKKWIVYDVDAIDFTSDEEEENNEALKAIKQSHEKVDSESEDDDFKDDLNFRYKKRL